jgi:hypothetical protein
VASLFLCSPVINYSLMRRFRLFRVTIRAACRAVHPMLCRRRADAYIIGFGGFMPPDA